MGKTNKSNLPLHLRRLTVEESRAIRDSRMDAMFQKLTASQKEHYRDVPKGCRYNYLKAHTTSSMTAMVKAMCNQCFGYDDLAAAIPECSCEWCPVWSFRKGATTKETK